MYHMERPNVPNIDQAAPWLMAAAKAQGGQAVFAVGCAYEDWRAAQCEADMHRAVLREKDEVKQNGNPSSEVSLYGRTQ